MAAVNETYRFITSTPGISGGHARIENTRIGVHDIIGSLQNGETVDSVSRCHPGVTRDEANECIVYYGKHRAEIDQLIASQMTDPQE